MELTREDSMRIRRKFLCIVVLAFAAGATNAAGLKQIGMIEMPGQPSNQFSTSLLDQATGLYYLTDRDNKSVSVVDTNTDKFVARIPGFVGVTDKGGDTFGPNSVAIVHNGSEAWITDGDSTIKIVDLKTNKVTDTISTGGNKRSNEIAYDPKDETLLVTNPNDKPPFLTLISAKDHKVLAKTPLPEATESLERIVYFEPTGSFLVDVPVLNHEHTKGGLAEVDPKTGKVIKMHVIENCNPHSHALISGSQFFIGCAAGAKGTELPPQMAVYDVSTDKVVAYMPGIGGAGTSAVNARAGQYYAAANNNPGGSALGVYDAKTNSMIQHIPTWTGSHSIQVNLKNNHVYLPTRGNSGPCKGCILVFAPE
jgi:DNA-binding beta-propeller fold protein YncE